MAEIFVDVLEQIPRGLVYVALGLIVIVIARFAQDLTTPYKIQEQLSHKDNIALALSHIWLLPGRDNRIPGRLVPAVCGGD